MLIHITLFCSSFPSDFIVREQLPSLTLLSYFRILALSRDPAQKLIGIMVFTTGMWQVQGPGHMTPSISSFRVNLHSTERAPVLPRPDPVNWHLTALVLLWSLPLPLLVMVRNFPLLKALAIKKYLTIDYLGPLISVRSGLICFKGNWNVSSPLPALKIPTQFLKPSCNVADCMAFSESFPAPGRTKVLCYVPLL